MFSTALRQRQVTRKAAGMRPWLEALESRTVLSTFKVNTLLDTVAVNLQTGKDASGHVSLRSAIMAADAKPNADTIIIPGGTYQLTIAGANEDNSATGDLDIKGNVTITGQSSSSTIIDGNSLDRVFQILSGRVQMSGLTIQHGLAAFGWRCGTGDPDRLPVDIAVRGTDETITENLRTVSKPKGMPWTVGR
jgi:hypothetical protein